MELYCRAGRSQMTIWRMRIACWISEGTNKNTGSVILVAFPPQQWLYEHISLLHYMRTVFRVFSIFSKKMKMINAQQAKIFRR